MSWVFKHSEAEGNERLCLLVLANYADEEGLSWPSVGRIAKEMRVAQRTAQRTLHNLAEGGHITIVPHGAPDSRQPANRKTNAYRVLSGGRSTEGSRGDNGVTPSSDGGVTGDAPRGDSPGSSGVTLLSPKPPVDPSVDPSEDAGAEAPTSSAANSVKAPRAAKGSARNGAAKLAPDTFVVTDDMRAWAAEKVRGVEVDAQTEQFLDWWRATGKSFRDPIAGWRNWLRRSKPGGLAPWQKPDKTNRNPANTYGDEHRVGGGRRFQ